MKRISSRENPAYKRVLRISEGKERGWAVIEGIHLCRAWLDHVDQPDVALFDEDGLGPDGEQAELASRLDAHRCLMCESRSWRAVSGVEHGQGVLFVVRVPRPDVPPIIDRNCIWLDRVQDPGNLGTLLRTAAAAGIRQAYLSEGCAHAWSQKVLRSAQGAHFVMAVYERQELQALRARLRIPLVVTSLRDARSIDDVVLPADCAWLFGNEGRGVADDLLDVADERVFIPQAATVESLNVGAAAAICLFEQRRRHRAGAA
ncbi:MAG TPA: RNA methyltransferase [Burkholderiaceae bacterium]|nr:RNA methyltransferase [Burkholderiaceae bacterium]